MGLLDIRKVPKLQEDLADLPNFMKKHDSHSLNFSNHHQSMGFWVGVGGDIDSGLHFDQNRGGFMYLASGKKQILMFPQEDKQHLYMRKEGGHKMESSIFCAKVLQEMWVVNR